MHEKIKELCRYVYVLLDCSSSKLIRPCIMYCTTFWGNSRVASHTCDVNKLLDRAIRIITGCKDESGADAQKFINIYDFE